MSSFVRMGCRLSLKESSVSIFRTSLLMQNVFFSESPVCIQACTRWPAFAMASFRCNGFDAMDYNELTTCDIRLSQVFRSAVSKRSQNEAHRRFFDRPSKMPNQKMMMMIKMPNHKRRCSPPELGDLRNQSKGQKERCRWS